MLFGSSKEDGLGRAFEYHDNAIPIHLGTFDGDHPEQLIHQSLLIQCPDSVGDLTPNHWFLCSWFNGKWRKVARLVLSSSTGYVSSVSTWLMGAIVGDDMVIDSAASLYIVYGTASDVCSSSPSTTVLAPTHQIALAKTLAQLMADSASPPGDIALQVENDGCDSSSSHAVVADKSTYLRESLEQEHEREQKMVDGGGGGGGSGGNSAGGACPCCLPQHLFSRCLSVLQKREKMIVLALFIIGALLLAVTMYRFWSNWYSVKDLLSHIQQDVQALKLQKV
jgi:hypothetical protein